MTVFPQVGYHTVLSCIPIGESFRELCLPWSLRSPRSIYPGRTRQRTGKAEKLHVAVGLFRSVLVHGWIGYGVRQPAGRRSVLRDFIRRKEEGGPLRIRKVPTYYDIVSYREIIDGSGTGTIFVVCMICTRLYRYTCDYSVEPDISGGRIGLKRNL
jgi:hypothetical protein